MVLFDFRIDVDKAKADNDNVAKKALASNVAIEADAANEADIANEADEANEAD
jgi:hypothetical protein